MLAVPVIALLADVFSLAVAALAAWRHSLGGEDLPSGNDVSQRDRLVLLPLAYELLALDKYGKALAGALVEDLGVSCVSTSHVCGDVCWLVGDGDRGLNG